jgi:hypothetical protein
MPDVVKYGQYVFDENQENILSGTITGDGKLELKVYFKKQFTVTYKDGVHAEVFDDVVYSTIDYASETPVFGSDPTRENYIFGGFGTIAEYVTTDVTYTATWIEDFNNNRIPDSEELVEITYHAGDHGTINGQTSLTTEKKYLPGYDTYPEAPTITPEEGYKTNGFEGYKTITIPLDNPTLEFVGNNELLKFTVKFVDYDDEVIKEEIVAYNENATAPADPSRENYTFAGWDKEFANIKSDLVVKANYTPNQIGIVVVEKPNQNWVFQKYQTVDLANMIDVYEKYADETLSNEPVTNYKGDLTTASIGNNSILTITQNGFTDTSIKYNV